MAEQQGEFKSAAVPPPAAHAGEEMAQEKVDGAEDKAAHMASPASRPTHAPEPAGAVITPLTGVLAIALAAASYALSKRLGKDSPEKSLAVRDYRADVPQAPIERVTPGPSSDRVRTKSRIGRGVSALGTGLKGATLVARHVPAKWAAWGAVAGGVLSKWRQKQAEYAVEDATARLEADVRALRRLSRRRRG